PKMWLFTCLLFHRTGRLVFFFAAQGDDGLLFRRTGRLWVARSNQIVGATFPAGGLARGV
ncbi:MAG: hypothetical protein AAF350_07180, partial [Pseudomonadota bacterium]